MRNEKRNDKRHLWEHFKKLIVIGLLFELIVKCIMYVFELKVVFCFRHLQRNAVRKIICVMIACTTVNIDEKEEFKVVKN